MDFKTKFLIGIIIILSFIIVLQRCNPNINTKIRYKDSTHITYDTISITVKDSGHTQPKQKDSISYPVYTIKYIPDTTGIKELLAQYKMLYSDYSMKRVYNDTLKIDSNGVKGYVDIIDTTQFNKLQQRHFDFNLSYNKIKETVIVNHYIPNARKLFIGGALLFTKGNPIYGGKVGLIYLDRQDRMYSGHIGIDINQQSFIEAGMYWKFNLKKK